MGEELGPEADAQDRAVALDHPRRISTSFARNGYLSLADVGDAHRPAEDDQAAHLVEVGRDLVALVEVADFDGDAEVPEDRDDAPGPFGCDVLQDDGFTHIRKRRMIGGGRMACQGWGDPTGDGKREGSTWLRLSPSEPPATADDVEFFQVLTVMGLCSRRRDWKRNVRLGR